MVRSRATSAEDLRADSTTAPEKSGASRIRYFRWLPVLVVGFVSLAAFALIQQATSSRAERLAAGEAALMLAAHLLASEIARDPQSVLGNQIPALPARVQRAGRRLFVVNGQGVIIAANAAGIEAGQNWQALVQNAEELARHLSGGSNAQAPMANGEMASFARASINGQDQFVLAFEPVAQNLLGWLQDIHTIGAIFLCFTAVVTAFLATYYAQRERVLKIGARSASQRSEIEAALEHGRCGLWNLPLHGDGCAPASASLRHLLGIPSHVSLTLGDIEARLHTEDAGLFARIDADRREGRTRIDHLFRVLHETRGWIWLRMRLIPAQEGDTRLVGILMDVTEERAQDEEIRKVDAQLRDAVESISEAFVLWDESNRLVMCNSKYRNFHAIPVEFARRGMPYRSVMEQANAPRIMNEIEYGTPGPRGARSYEAQLQDGRWLLVSERHTRDGGYVSVGTDITARKMQEEQLIENERQLRITVADLGTSREALRRQATQLSELADRYLEQKAAAIGANRAKAEFLANMHHEIRTPINHIIGFAELIEHEIFGPCGSPRYVEYARDIRRGGANLMALIADILDMAQVEAGRVKIERTPTPIGALLDEAVQEVREAVEAKSLSLEVEPTLMEPAGQIMIRVDSGAIRKAMVQLLRSSIRLSPHGGRVSVRARMAHNHVNIFIADAGCVLSQGDIGTMADAFGHIDGMLDDGCKGSGLNIPIARALIELHGGTMRMRSAPDYGSLVMIHLPISPEAVQLDLPIRGMAA